MCVLSTLRTSISQLIGARVTWHPQGITAVRRFTIESCAALPKRSLKKKPVSVIKDSNPEDACPFIIIPEPESQEDIYNDFEESIELIMLTDQCYPDNFLCHTHRRDYIEWRSEQQMNEAIRNNYVTELPLSFIEEEEYTLYD